MHFHPTSSANGSSPDPEKIKVTTPIFFPLAKNRLPAAAIPALSLAIEPPLSSSPLANSESPASSSQVSPQVSPQGNLLGDPLVLSLGTPVGAPLAVPFKEPSNNVSTDVPGDMSEWFEQFNTWVRIQFFDLRVRMGVMFPPSGSRLGQLQHLYDMGHVCRCFDLDDVTVASYWVEYLSEYSQRADAFRHTQLRCGVQSVITPVSLEYGPPTSCSNTRPPTHDPAPCKEVG
jgi:hypothetical protein